MPETQQVTESRASDAPSFPKRDFRQEVTNQIVEMLEKGTAPWQTPWEPGTLRLPFNPRQTGHTGAATPFISWLSANATVSMIPGGSPTARRRKTDGRSEKVKREPRSSTGNSMPLQKLVPTRGMRRRRSTLSPSVRRSHSPDLHGVQREADRRHP